MGLTTGHDRLCSNDGEVVAVRKSTRSHVSQRSWLSAAKCEEARYERAEVHHHHISQAEGYRRDEP